MKRTLTGASLGVAGIMFGIAMSLLAGQPPAPVAYAGNFTDPAQTEHDPLGDKAASLGISQADATDGALRTVADGKPGAYCPLKHTDVKAEISGFVARVSVTQEFVNPTSDRVEAIYTFPLPNDAAVDDMTMHVGDRVIKGLIKKREDAQKIYEDARRAGHTAALLDQERPNIFTQSVANIPANAPVKVVISYVETLTYEAGVYQFVYPMVVGPRYIPGSPISKQAGGWAHDTTQVPDASRITPPVAGVHVGQKGSRAGHDISLAVRLNAGVPIQSLKSVTHALALEQPTARSAVVTLKNEKEIPNRDFVLTYDVSGSQIGDALLTHARATEVHSDVKGGGIDATTGTGFFTFILQPPDRVRDEDATSRELIFVLDTSGSMSGYPIETAQKVMKRAIENMRAGDTFNLITFSGDTRVLFPEPQIASSQNISRALSFLASQRGSGGTEMMKAIKVALGDSGEGIAECKPGQDCAVQPVVRRRADGDAIRIVCFMTDGYVGNDMAILGEIQKHTDARVFSFGIGSSVNRFLLDGMASAGRGEVEYVLRQEDAEPAAKRFYERVHTPVLTDISIDWGKLPVSGVIPQKPLDLFTAKPLVISGRYSDAASGTIVLRGKRSGRPFEREIKVDLPRRNDENRSLAQLWARRRIDQLMSADWEGIQNGSPRIEVRDQITQLGLDYRLMTQFTSFVAVEEQTVVEGGQTRTIHVPVEMTHNVSAEGVFGGMQELRVAKNAIGAGYGVGGSMFNTAPASVSTSSAETVEVTAGGEGAYIGSGNPVDPIFKSKEERARIRAEKDARQRKLLEEKLHPGLLATYQCWRTGNKKCSGLEKNVVKVQVLLSVRTRQFEQELTQIGFVPLPPSKNAVASALEFVGHIPIERLHLLAEQSEVKLIALAK